MAGKTDVPDLRVNGVVDLEKITGFGRDPNWSSSYINLREYAFFWDNARFTAPKTTPGKFGAMESKLYQMLKKGHHKVELTEEEMHRIALWLDTNSNFFGAYNNTKEQLAGEVVHPDMY